MEQTTAARVYTYYFYHLPDDEDLTYNGDVIDWPSDTVHPDTAHSSNGEHGAGAGGGWGGGGGGRGEEDAVYHNSSHERGFVHSANIGIVITVVNMLLNLLLVALVLSRRSTRRQFVYQQIINLAASDLAFSVMVDPFTVYFELQPWRLAPAYCVVWMVLDAALPFVSFLALITLNVDRLLFALSPSLYHATFSRAWVRGLVLLLPWGLGLGVMLPLWLLTAVVWPEHGICMYGITKRAAMASAVVSLYLPCVVLIALSVLVLVTIIGGMPQDVHELSALRVGGGGGGHVGVDGGGECTTHLTVAVRPGLNLHGPPGSWRGSLGGGGLEAERPEVKKSHKCLVVALCVLNLLTVITQLPYGAISMLEPECVEETCHSTIKLIQALGWTRSVTFSLHPFCLIALTRLRRMLFSCPPSGTGSHSGSGSGLERYDPPALLVTPSGVTKSDQMELTSVNTAIVQPQEKGNSTML